MVSFWHDGKHHIVKWILCQYVDAKVVTIELVIVHCAIDCWLNKRVTEITRLTFQHIYIGYSTVLHSTCRDGSGELFVSRTHLGFLSFRKPNDFWSDLSFDTAENEPCKVCPLSAYGYPRFLSDRTERACHHWIDASTAPRDSSAPLLIKHWSGFLKHTPKAC